MHISSPDNLVLLTGATGHIGSCTLIHLLRAGYHVRAAVRSETKIKQVLSWPEIRSLGPNLPLEFVIVPDITVEKAYEAAVQDVTTVIHIASPLLTGHVPPHKQKEYFVPPAVRGTIGMLEAANRSGTVRRVVITSSIAALTPVAQLEGYEPRSASAGPVLPTDRVAPSEEPYNSEFDAYAASKAAALLNAEVWVEREQPAFDVIHLHPGFVLGHSPIARSPSEAFRGTNGIVLALLLGKKFGPYAGATVHVGDVARAHVNALSLMVPGNTSYTLSRPACWNDAKHIVARRYPAAIKARSFVDSGNIDTVHIDIDSTHTQDVLGISFRSFEEQVESVVAQYLDLLDEQRRVRIAAATAAAKATARTTKVPTPSDYLVPRASPDPFDLQARQ